MADALNGQTSPVLPQAIGAGRSEAQLHLRRVLQQEARQSFDDWTVYVASTARELSDGTTHRGVTESALGDAVLLYARQSSSDSLEAFAQDLSHALLNHFEQCTAVEIRVASHLWKPLALNGELFSAALMKGSNERQTARISHPRDSVPALSCGFTSMTLLKTGNASSPHMSETTISAEWAYTDQSLAGAGAFNKLRRQVREHLIAVYAQHDFADTPQMLDFMVGSALKSVTALNEITVRASARNCPSVNDGGGLTPCLFLPEEEPGAPVELKAHQQRRTA